MNGTHAWPGSCQLTGFGRSLCGKVRGKLLEDLRAVFLHEEANEVGGGIELQGQRGRELALPATDRGLQGFPQGVHLAVLTLAGENKTLHSEGGGGLPLLNIWHPLPRGWRPRTPSLNPRFCL